jgi:hypothetical protein
MSYNEFRLGIGGILNSGLFVLFYFLPNGLRVTEALLVPFFCSGSSYCQPGPSG